MSFFEDVDMTELESGINPKKIAETAEHNEQELPPPVRQIASEKKPVKSEQEEQEKSMRNREFQENSVRSKSSIASKESEPLSTEKHAPVENREVYFPEPDTEEMEMISHTQEQKEKVQTDTKEIKKNAISDSTNRKEVGATVISNGTIVEGNIAADGALSVDGQINGHATAKTGLNVLRHGVVNGGVSASGKVTILGKVVGDVEGDDVQLEKTRIRGDVRSNGNIAISNGAVVIGNVSGQSAVICGAVCGDIDVKGHVSIESTAIVKGNIRSKSVQVAIGAAVDGVCTQCYADVSPSAFFDDFNSDCE